MTTLPKLYVKNLELSKYTRYRILIPYDNINVHLTGVNGEKSESPQIANMDTIVNLILILTLTQAGTM